MRSRTGHVGSKEFHAILEKSRLHELDSHHMTTKEMELDPRVVNTLKANEVIESRGKTTGCHGRYQIWGPGSKYKMYMKKWGWA